MKTSSLLLVSAGCLLFWSGQAMAAEPISFRNDVMAVLSKAGCNQGTCHGNANGKGGFKLSLRGDTPRVDYDVLTRGGQGRRLNLEQPAQSLILLKATQQLAHEGGRRFEVNSLEYRILHAWLAAGAHPDTNDVKQLVALEVTPATQVLVAPQWEQQIQVLARFTDGSERDVTTLAVYEPSQPTVNITPAGVVTADKPTEVTIGVRFLDQQRPVRLAFIENVPSDDWPGPPPANAVDDYVFAKLQQVRLHPAPVCDDTTYVRRAYLDLLGRIPSAHEAREFVNSTSSTKRSDLVDNLIEHPQFAQNWALKWADLIRVEEKTLDRKGAQDIYAWLTHQFAVNRPLDEMCRDLVSARGSTYAHPPANYYRSMRDTVTRAESTAQVMLGIRLQCAKCHNHPFDRWKQDDYYGWASLFAQVDYKILENDRRDDNDKHEFIGEQIVYINPKAEIDDPRTGKKSLPLLLDASAPLGPDADRLSVVADWIVSPENPYFARAQVNRIWYHLLGQGIVDPIDDFRLTNAPSNPQLLSWLAEDFVQHGYDVQRTIRLVMNSRTYQLSADVNDRNRDDELNFSHGRVRRLTAEQLLDSLTQATGVGAEFNGYPPGVRAGALAGVRPPRRRDRDPAAGDKFLKIFGKPERLQSCECERSNEGTLSQTFQFVSGPLVDYMLSDETGYIGRELRSHAATDEIIIGLYWGTVSRAPSPVELSTALALAEANGRAGLEDLLWGLVNSNEFLLRR